MCAAQRKTQGSDFCAVNFYQNILRNKIYWKKHNVDRGVYINILPNPSIFDFHRNEQIPPILKNNVLWSNVFLQSIRNHDKSNHSGSWFPCFSGLALVVAPHHQGPQVPALPLQVVNPLQRIFLGGPAWEMFMSQKVENMLHPWKQPEFPLKIDGWKMYSLLKWSPFRGHVSFQGCKLSKISVKLQLISTIFVQFCGDAIFKRRFPWSNTVCCNNVIWLSKHLLEKTTRSSFASPPLGSETCKWSHQTTRKLHL